MIFDYMNGAILAWLFSLPYHAQGVLAYSTFLFAHHARYSSGLPRPKADLSRHGSVRKSGYTDGNATEREAHGERAGKEAEEHRRRG